MKKGFTLVELMAILVILSVLLLIGTSSVSKIVKENRQKLYQEQIEAFKDAAMVWSYANTNLLPTDSNSYKITLETLKNDNLIKSNIVNPVTKEVFSYNDWICIFNINGSYIYEYNGEC